MAATNHQLRAFFDEYEARINKGLAVKPEVDVEGTVNAFTDTFIEASPQGVHCAHSNEFRANVAKGIALYRSIGTKSMHVKALTITPLDDLHVMAKVDWQAFYVKKDGSNLTLEFPVIYLLQTLNNTPKIFAYIAGDEQKAYRELGLTPQSAD